MIKTKTHKRKKSGRMLGRGAGSCGWGARKKHKKAGHKGGVGMSGTGKRADQKKTLVINLYGNDYFGKQGITSRGTKRDTRQRINLDDIQRNLETYGKKQGDKWEVNLEKYKILAGKEVKTKFLIKAKEASVKAIEQIKKAGGEIILTQKEAEE
jgi:large subunit ribosomal protein L15